MSVKKRLFSACFVGGLAAPVIFASAVYRVSAEISDSSESARIEAVRVFADNVLEYGRDRWGDYESPLFTDGVEVDTMEPVVWRYRDKEWVISNFASQQNLLRVLVGLSNLTGNDEYRKAAEEAVEYMFENHRAGCGLLYWGGHQFVDLRTGENVGEFDANCHEFKNNFPFYQFLWEVDKEATAQFLRAFWNAHIENWEILDMNRHGRFEKAMGALWENEFGEPESFFEGRGLTFINAGTDLIYAGVMLYQYKNEKGALEWAERLAEQYVNARHPETGLGVYQYSKPLRRRDPPEEGPLTGELTYSSYGDRAQNQFGKVYGEVAREGWVLFAGRPRAIYAINGLIQLHVADRLGEKGKNFLKWTVDGLKAYADYGYKAGQNHFRPMWADGTDLSGETYPRTGYYGRKNNEFASMRACEIFLLTYSRAYRLTGDNELWDIVRNMVKGNGLGDPGISPGRQVELNMKTANSDPASLFAMLELYGIEAHSDYIDLAKVIGDNILEQRFHKGFFLPSERHIYAKFDAVEPLALLSLEAVLDGIFDKIPEYIAGRGYIHGSYDGYGRTYDSRVLWSAKKSGN